jgi:hypothetical protein
VVRDGHGRHPELARPLEQLVELDRAVQERVLGMEVEMDESGVGHGRLSG